MISRIYLDANVLETRWPYLAGELQILAGLAALASTELCVPESVLIEHENSTLRRVKDSLQQAEKHLADVNARIRGMLPVFDLQGFNVESFRAEYARGVRAAQKHFRITVAPTTSLSIGEFVLRAAQHQPPFKKEDRGFRDAVHLQSAIDHLRDSPVKDGESFFMTTDGRVTASDTAAFVAAGGSSLKMLSSIRAGIELVKAQLPPVTERRFHRLGEVWTPDLLRDAAGFLFNRMRLALNGTQLGDIRLVSPKPLSVELEYGTMNVGPPAGGDTVYPVSFELRVPCESFGWRRDASSPSGGVSWGGSPTFLVAVDTSAEADAELKLARVTYRSARVFAVVWPPKSGGSPGAENLAESIELTAIAEPTFL